MMNHITLMGRLTRDPELRRTQSGIPVTSFSLAVPRDYKDKETGEADTDFIDVVAWRHNADFVSNYFSKGRVAVVEGRLQLRNWTDNEGNKRRSAEILAERIYFGDYTKDAAANPKAPRAAAPVAPAAAGYEAEAEGELPF